jgi:hypothetical protein
LSRGGTESSRLVNEEEIMNAFCLRVKECLTIINWPPEAPKIELT